MQVKKQQLEPCMDGIDDWFKIEKGVQQVCLLSPCLFNLYVEHIMRNAGLDELQAGIKTGRRTINSLRYDSFRLDDSTLMAESKDELKSLLMRVKDSERDCLKLNIKKKNPGIQQHHYFMAKRGGKDGSSDRFPLLGLNNYCGW